MVIPKEARDGLMRAWIKVLSDRHPHVTWVPAYEPDVTPATAGPSQPVARVELANSA